MLQIVLVIKLPLNQIKNEPIIVHTYTKNLVDFLQ